jgi:hypothetical protein
MCKFLMKFAVLSEAEELLLVSARDSRSFPFDKLRVRMTSVIDATSYSPASIRDLGSSRSRNASPIKLKARTANITVTAGKSTR